MTENHVKYSGERAFRELARDPFLAQVLRITFTALQDGRPQGEARDNHLLAMQIVTNLDEQKCLRNHVPPSTPKTKAML